MSAVSATSEMWNGDEDRGLRMAGVIIDWWIGGKCVNSVFGGVLRVACCVKQDSAIFGYSWAKLFPTVIPMAVPMSTPAAKSENQ